MLVFSDAILQALAGVIEANIVGFSGSIKVTTDESYPFAAEAKKARVFYVTLNGPIQDIIVDLKRALVGVSFPALTQGDDRISQYVLGRLAEGTTEYAIARQQTHEVFTQGRRFRIILSEDTSAFAFLIDQNQPGMCFIL